MDKRPAFDLIARRVAEARIPEPIVLPAPPPDTSIQDALDSIAWQIAQKPVPDVQVDVEGAMRLLLSGLEEMRAEPATGLLTLIDAIGEIGQAIAALKMPEVSIDLDKAVKSLVSGLAKLKSDPMPVDLSPVVKAIQGVTMTVNVPPAPVAEPVAQGPVTFTIERDSSGRMTRVIAVPGVVAAPVDELSSFLDSV